MFTLKRRAFISTVCVTAAILLAGAPALASPPAAAPPRGKRPLNIGQFSGAIASMCNARAAELDAKLIYATIPTIQAQFNQKTLTSLELTTYYLRRIQKYDVDALNSVIELNPDALVIAKRLDDERAAGTVRGPLHGTVALLKDNIATGDQMHTTGGARALQNAQADRDAFVVKKLRDAGVVILGKAALSEFAHWVDDSMPSGYSTVGGQPVSPYGKQIDPWGSSTGPAIAVVSNFATFGLGTETWGSVIAPAMFGSAVALKPSIGLVSRDRVIPILDSQDSVGPFTRNVIDLALVMDALVGTDLNDPVTAAALNRRAPFENGLNLDSLKGMRVGVVPVFDDADGPAQSHMIDVLRVAGAEVVFLPQQPDPFFDLYGDDFLALGRYGFKAGIARYLAATHGPVRTAAEIAAFNLEDPADRIRYGQRQLVASAESTMTPAEYAQRSLAVGDRARAGLNKLMTDNRLDLMAGTGIGVFTNYGYPPAGYPALAIPAGYRPSGDPIGFALVGNLFDDWKLVRAAYTLELISKMWRAPALLAVSC